MTIKWVQQDPLVLNGEPFCYGSRLTVRQLLEVRANGYDLTRILTDHPELKTLGVAAAYTYAAEHRERYADFFEADGSLAGPGLHRCRGGRAARAVPRRRDRAEVDGRGGRVASPERADQGPPDSRAGIASCYRYLDGPDASPYASGLRSGRNRRSGGQLRAGIA